MKEVVVRFFYFFGFCDGKGQWNWWKLRACEVGLGCVFGFCVGVVLGFDVICGLYTVSFL